MFLANGNKDQLSLISIDPVPMPDLARVSLPPEEGHVHMTRGSSEYATKHGETDTQPRENRETK